MRIPLKARIKPKKGVSNILHIAFTVLLPLLVFVLVRIDFPQMALGVILLSKWRMLAVKPRHWPANIRANAIDMIVGVSALTFMLHGDSQLFQMFWAVAYGVWLLVVKPGSQVLGVSAQALIGQLAGLSALFLQFGEMPIAVLVVAAWLICYLAARHFLTSFDEPLTRLLSYLWGYFAGALTWLLAHWLLFYGSMAQPTLLLGVLAFGLGTLYYLAETDRLSVLYRRQILFIMAAIVVIIIVSSDWGDKTI
jgi:hypothetical protein